MIARAYWTVGPGRGELREERLAAPGPDEVLVRTALTGISRGTETLVHRGGVPAEVARQMRAPFQAGDLPGPVKYGYLAVGTVEEGPDHLRGRRVFALHPHQDRFVVPLAAVTPVPDAVPDARALLAGTVETALNALWDAAPLYGDRVAVVGAGQVGAAVAALLASMPLERLELVDVDPARREVADRLGVDLVTPEAAAGGCDLVWHASATEQGATTALGLLGQEGELVELSWYGDRSPRLPLGGAFHARRLVLRSSQVGSVAPARRARRTPGDRLATALGVLADPRFDALLGTTVDLAALPATMDDLVAGRLGPGCHVVSHV